MTMYFISNHHFFQIVYTVSKGVISMFFKWSDLGSNIHVTDAKVDDAYNVCTQIKSAFDTMIASISVDNAACKVAESAAKKLQADGDPALPLHDPAHCIDLLSKDLATTSVVCSVLGRGSRIKIFI
jgi:hypothetical protein